jgi:acetyl-CoA carboxylase biotin carboxyl carrier protein
MRLGTIEVLGAKLDLLVPPSLQGVMLFLERRTAGGRSRSAVSYGDPLVLLDSTAGGPGGAGGAEERTYGMVFASPMSGRFYRRAAPDKPPFVVEGDEIGAGQTICLLEVMKTFNRITYGGGSDLPRAKVLRVIPAEGDDLAAGDPILELQPV